MLEVSLKERTKQSNLYHFWFNRKIQVDQNSRHNLIEEEIDAKDMV